MEAVWTEIVLANSRNKLRETLENPVDAIIIFLIVLAHQNMVNNAFEDSKKNIE